MRQSIVESVANDLRLLLSGNIRSVNRTVYLTEIYDIVQAFHNARLKFTVRKVESDSESTVLTFYFPVLGQGSYAIEVSKFLPLRDNDIPYLAGSGILTSGELAEIASLIEFTCEDYVPQIGCTCQLCGRWFDSESLIMKAYGVPSYLGTLTSTVEIDDLLNGVNPYNTGDLLRRASQSLSCASESFSEFGNAVSDYARALARSGTFGFGSEERNPYLSYIYYDCEE